jgi:hypothetical protein
MQITFDTHEKFYRQLGKINLLEKRRLNLVGRKARIPD